MRDKQYEGIVTKQEYVSHLRLRIKSIYARCRKSAKAMNYIFFLDFVPQTSQELRMLSRSLSNCQSLTLNVMISVSQFVRNSQLCQQVTKSLNRSQCLCLCLDDDGDDEDDYYSILT